MPEDTPNELSPAKVRIGLAIDRGGAGGGARDDGRGRLARWARRSCSPSSCWSWCAPTCCTARCAASSDRRRSLRPGSARQLAHVEQEAGSPVWVCTRTPSGARRRRSRRITRSSCAGLVGLDAGAGGVQQLGPADQGLGPDQQRDQHPLLQWGHGHPPAHRGAAGRRRRAPPAPAAPGDGGAARGGRRPRPGRRLPGPSPPGRPRWPAGHGGRPPPAAGPGRGGPGRHARRPSAGHRTTGTSSSVVVAPRRDVEMRHRHRRRTYDADVSTYRAVC